MMRVSREQAANAAVGSVEAKRHAKLPPPVIDWNKQIAHLKAMLDQLYP